MGGRSQRKDRSAHGSASSSPGTDHSAISRPGRPCSVRAFTTGRRAGGFPWGSLGWPVTSVALTPCGAAGSRAVVNGDATAAGHQPSPFGARRPNRRPVPLDGHAGCHGQSLRLFAPRTVPTHHPHELVVPSSVEESLSASCPTAPFPPLSFRDCRGISRPRPFERARRAPATVSRVAKAAPGTQMYGAHLTQGAWWHRSHCVWRG